jgi:uncharacterized protein
MSVESDVQSGAHAAPAPAPAPAAGNPALLGLMTFLPSGITLGLWFVGYLDTATEAGGMIPIVSLSAGLFLMVAAIAALRGGASTVAAIFGVFSAFWLSFGFLLIGATSGWWGITADNLASVQSTYLLSFLIVFVILTLGTLRLPLAFTAGFVLVCITFALAFLGVSTGNAGLFPIAGISTFLFCAVFAYILIDGLGQDLGGKAMPMGNALQK